MLMYTWSINRKHFVDKLINPSEDVNQRLLEERKLYVKMTRYDKKRHSSYMSLEPYDHLYSQISINNAKKIHTSSPPQELHTEMPFLTK